VLDTLTQHEYAFLEALHRVAPNLVSRTAVGDAIWGDGQWDVYMLHNLVSRLRRRLAGECADETVVVTVPGVGYRLD
jgi:DNA-binding winged helix-turn-helix (wHTH) protein